MINKMKNIKTPIKTPIRTTEATKTPIMNQKDNKIPKTPVMSPPA